MLIALAGNPCRPATPDGPDGGATLAAFYWIDAVRPDAAEKAQSLLDAILGFINIARANIIKLMTVVGVVGVPPTLIASIDDMNFENMPELHRHVGYQIAIAGAAVGVVAPAFETWHAAFWDNLAASIQLHKITRVIMVDRRDCGAAAIACGPEAIKTPEAEATLLDMVHGRFKAELAKRQPSIHAEGGLMALDDNIEMFAWPADGIPMP